MVDITTRPPEDDGDYPPYGDLKVPPHSLEAEQALLGGLLHNSRAYDAIYDVVGERDFYNRNHRAIWTLIAQQMERNKPADAITILDLADAETRIAIAGLLTHTPSIVNVRQYAQIIRDKSVLRSLIAAGREIEETASTHGTDPQEAAERAESLVLSIMDKDARDESREPVTLYQAFSQAVDWIESDKRDGVPTGFGQLDAMLPGGGMQPEQLVIVAGRPSTGKSSLTYCIAENLALQGRTVAYFALETSVREIGVRAIKWHETKLERREALQLVAQSPLLIDDTPAVSLSHIRVRCRRIRRQRGLSLIVVDYLQLMRQRASSRIEEISEISRGLKAIAKEFGVPVVAVSQLNRSVEQRPDKRPQLADLRESGQIEQDADVVLMCYRDEYYNPDTPEKGLGEIFVRKNRDGMTGSALLRWKGEYTRWLEYHGERPVAEKPVVTAGDSTKVRAFKPRGPGND